MSSTAFVGGGSLIDFIAEILNRRDLFRGIHNELDYVKVCIFSVSNVSRPSCCCGGIW